MREIKFRGKTKYESWVKGYYLKKVDEEGRKTHHILENYVDISRSSPGMKLRYNQVIPESVGQYTNRIDKESNMVYEGDIFEYEYVLGEGYKYQTTDNPEMFNGVDVVGFANSEFIGKKRYLMLSRYVNIKVIGNEFDNPELLGEDNNEQS